MHFRKAEGVVNFTISTSAVCFLFSSTTAVLGFLSASWSLQVCSIGLCTEVFDAAMTLRGYDMLRDRRRTAASAARLGVVARYPGTEPKGPEVRPGQGHLGVVFV